MELAPSLARMVQLLSAAILFGAPLFFLYAMPTSGPWRQKLLAGAIIAMAAGILAAGWMQAAELAGTPGFAALQDIAWYFRDTRLGNIAVARLLILAGCAYAVWRIRLERRRNTILAAIGALILTSFAWTGHGTEAGSIGTIADVIHLLMAGVWAGALAALLGGIFASRSNRLPPQTVAHGLAAFSRVGVVMVALLAASGLTKAFLAFGLPSWTIVRNEYGLTLAAKLFLFGCMLLLAALNRYRLSPNLDAAVLMGRTARPELRALYGSVLLETMLAVAVIGLAAHLGSIEPPAP